jgi:hypothetical protein
MMAKNSKTFEAGFSITFHNHNSQADDWLSAFSKAELKFPVLFNVPPELENLMWLPVKSPELASVFIEASKNLKSLFLNN